MREFLYFLGIDDKNRVGIVPANLEAFHYLEVQIREKHFFVNNLPAELYQLFLALIQGNSNGFSPFLILSIP